MDLIDKKKELKENIILILERFPFYKYAAKINRISEDTLKRMRDEDQDFADRCESSRASGIMKYANKASPEFMLKSVDPQTFKERVDLTSGDKPIPILDINVSKDDGNK